MNRTLFEVFDSGESFYIVAYDWQQAIDEFVTEFQYKPDGPVEEVDNDREIGFYDGTLDEDGPAKTAGEWAESHEVGYIGSSCGA